MVMFLLQPSSFSFLTTKLAAKCSGLVEHQRDDWRSRTVSWFDRNLAINRVFSIGHLQRWLQCLEVESRAQQKGDVEIKFGV